MAERKNFMEGFSIMLAFIWSGVMVAVGYNYTWELHNGGNVDGVHDGEDNLCPNGAAYWLLINGIVLLMSISFKGLFKIYKKCAERYVDKIDFGEKVVRFFTVSMAVVEFAMIDWGSAVVFTAWANWTDNFDVYKANPEELNFCEHIPMMTAVIILVLDWVLILLMIAIICFYACCCAIPAIIRAV